MAAGRARATRSRRRGLGVVASLLLATLLGVIGWRSSDAFFVAQARQRVANRWAALRRCLLGEGNDSSELPSERLRRLDGARSTAAPADAAGWPERCMPHARALDAALASRSLPVGLARLPRASEIVDSTVNLAQRAAELDRLWSALREADLPPAEADQAPDPSPPPGPPGQRPALARAKLAAFGRIGDLSAVDLQGNLGTGDSARLLLPMPSGQPVLCSVDEAPSNGGAVELDCRTVAARLPGAEIGWRLARFERGAPELVYGRTAAGKDGFFDAATGQRIWRPGSAEAQAVVSESGAVSVLYAVTRSSAGRAPRRDEPSLALDDTDHFQLARLRPGRPPANNWLDVPSTARVVLTDRFLVWWAQQDGSTGVYAQALGEGADPLGPRHRVGDVPAGSRLMAERSCQGVLALLLADRSPVPRHTLLVATGRDLPAPVDLGPFGGQIGLGCRGSSPSLAGLDPALGAVAWQCDDRSCARSAGAPPSTVSSAGTMASVAPLDAALVLVWWQPGTGVRMRIGSPPELESAPETVLLEPESSPVLRPKSLRLRGGEHAALLLVQDEAGDLRLLRIDPRGSVSALRPSPTVWASLR
jgi:hypothetical protein